MIFAAIDEFLSDLDPRIVHIGVGWAVMMVVIGALLAWKWLKKKNVQQQAPASPVAFQAESAAMLHKYNNLPEPLRAKQQKAVRNATVSGVVVTVIVVVGLILRSCLEHPAAR